MAFTLQTDLPCGVTVSHWEVVSFSVDLESQSIRVSVNGWVSESARTSGAPPVKDAFFERRFAFADIAMDQQLLGQFLDIVEGLIQPSI